MTVELDLSGASCVSIEVIKKTAKEVTDVYFGLFMGICSRKDEKDEEYKFITIMTSKNTIKLFNKIEYDVMSINIINYDTKCTTIFNKSSKDQNEAIENLEKISFHMIDIEKMGYHNDTKKELIDPTYYKEINNELNNELIGKNSVKKYTNKTSTKYNNSTKHNNEVKNKGPELGKIKRKGKLPNKNKLDDIKDKVKRIASGNYKMDPIPIPNCDKKEGKEDKEKKVVL